jgi:hypothetical protein
MTVEQLSAIAGIILSLAFSYVPGLSDWYGGQDPAVKRLIMAGLLLVVAVGALVLSCANIIADVECTQAGLLSLIGTFIAALIANQAVYLISPHRKKAAS